MLNAVVRRLRSAPSGRAALAFGGHERRLSGAPRQPPPPGQVASQTSDDTKQPTPFERKVAEARQQLQWRKPAAERTDMWFTKFSVFDSNKADSENDMFTKLQQPIDLSWSSRQAKKEKKRISDERFMQQFVPERHQILGNDLAAAHFLVYRGGAVKFVGQKKWIARTEEHNGEADLPKKFDARWRLEAIRCDNMELYYEGLENVRRLHQLKFLSLHNVRQFDDWCLDRVSGSDFPALEVLDVSGTAVTERGLCALYRLPTLKMLIVDDPRASNAFELTGALLEELMPGLKIARSSDIHSD